MGEICSQILKGLMYAKTMENGNYRDHTIYTRNNMGHKCEGNCGLWVLNEILKKTYPENLKKIVGAVWEIPAK